MPEPACTTCVNLCRPRYCLVRRAYLRRPDEHLCRHHEPMEPETELQALAALAAEVTEVRDGR